MTNRHAVALGKLGRAVNSEAQQEAARKNGLKGGRPAKYRCACGAAGGKLVFLARGRYKCKGCGAAGDLDAIETARPMCVECGRAKGHARDGKCSKGWPPNNAEGRIDG